MTYSGDRPRKQGGRASILQHCKLDDLNGDRQRRPDAVRQTCGAGRRESGEFRMGVIGTLTLLKDTKHDWAVCLAPSYLQGAGNLSVGQSGWKAR